MHAYWAEGRGFVLILIEASLFILRLVIGFWFVVSAIAAVIITVYLRFDLLSQGGGLYAECSEQCSGPNSADFVYRSRRNRQGSAAEATAKVLREVRQFSIKSEQWITSSIR